MLEQTKKTSFRISSVLSNGEPGAESRAGPSHRLRPKSTDSDRLCNTESTSHMYLRRVTRTKRILILGSQGVPALPENCSIKEEDSKSESQLKEPEPDPATVKPIKIQRRRCEVCYSEAENWNAARGLSQVRPSITWFYFWGQ